jgi:hypothetical protein
VYQIKTTPDSGDILIYKLSPSYSSQLRHSGYPLTNPWGDEYPDKFKIEGTNTYSINLRSNNISVAFFALNPLPGNWYGAAYIREREDNHIAQKVSIMEPHWCSGLGL